MNSTDLSCTLSVLSPEGVTLSLYSALKEGEIIPPDHSDFENGTVRWCYTVKKGQKLRVEASGAGYYSLTQSLWIQGDEIVTLAPTPAEGRGFEPKEKPVSQYVPSAWKKMAPEKESAWDQWTGMFDTPAFSPASRGLHRATTHEEMLDFVEMLAKKNPRLKKFDLFTSPVNGYTVPIVLFSSTDLSKVHTLKEAATLLRTNGRPIVHYQAQIHGNEPAGGEGALSMMQYLCTYEGQKLLKDIDVYIIPRVNPDGAHDYVRSNVAEKKNLNRDWIALSCVETAAVARAYRLFMPEIFIDGHEYTGAHQSESGTYHDIMMACAAGQNTRRELLLAGLKVIYRVFDRLKENKLRGFFYSGCVNGTNPCTGTKYAALRGSIPFLVESRGIHLGQHRFHRRVAGQYISVRTILEEIAKNPVFYRDLVAEERLILADRAGKEFVLHSGFSKTAPSKHRYSVPTFDYMTGEILSEKEKDGWEVDLFLKKRILPAAYVIPLGMPWEKDVLELLKKHGIAFRLDEAGVEYRVTQYLGSAEDAQISSPKTVKFSQGAAVIPVNQVASNVVAYLFEPDCEDSAKDKASLVHLGVLRAENGEFPIYRMENVCQLTQ